MSTEVDLMRMIDAAKVCRVTRQAIDKQCRAGVFRTHRIGRAVYLETDQVIEYMKRRAGK
jgi:hypothetical protein